MTDRTYLTPEELDFESDDGVRELGDGRYVVAVDSAGAGDRDGANRRTGRGEKEGSRRSEAAESVGDAPPTEGATDEGRYYLELGARTDVAEDETVVTGDDIGAVFADALRWYARRVAPDEDPETVVDVLLQDTEFSVRGRVPDR